VKTYGVVLAGGVGARLGLSVPKQMVKVAGKTILEHTVSVFENSNEIDEIIVMITQGWSEHAATVLGSKFPKVSQILEGGTTRNETTRKVLEVIPEIESKLLLHDAVRPLLDEHVLQACVDELESHSAVDVVIPSADTIVNVDDEGFILSIPDRSRLRRGQTPQAFKLSTLRDAYALAMEDPYFSATDDCGVVLKYRPDIPIKTVFGTEQNIKITHPVDLFIADKLFQLASQSSPRAQSNQPETLQGKTIVIFGGSYGIGAEIARMARSLGAEVVAHGRSTTGLHVESLKDIEEALESTANAYGGIDAVVLTAGVLEVGKLSDMDDKQVHESISVNFNAPVNIARAAYPHLAKSKGHLLFFTSSSYTRGRQNYALYSSTKAAVVNLTQALSEEWSERDIKVNVINPERTATPMRTNAFGDEPPGTLLAAETVARSSLDVLSSEMTGVVFDVRRESTSEI